MKNIILLILIFASPSLSAQQKLEDCKKGEFRLKLGLPYLNHLLLKPNNTTTVNKAGFVGESLGLEYCYSDSRFLELSFSFAGAADNPLPFAIDKEGKYTSQYSSYFSITHNQQKDRLTIGYGMNYSINTWKEGFRSLENASLDTSSQITHQAIGFTLNSYYRMAKSFHVGIIYRPTFFRIDGWQNRYEHLISLEFLWKIRLNKKQELN